MIRVSGGNGHSTKEVLSHNAPEAHRSLTMADLTNVKLTVNIDFECHIDGKKENEKRQYQATVEFSSIEKLLERGGESVKRTLQTKARDGKFPLGRRVTVNEEGVYAKSAEEKAADTISAIMETDDEAQLDAMFVAFQEKKAAKAAAEKAAFDAAKKAKKA
jgi:trehalose/maltose hydrolase-like predicted phosphorylase